MKDGKGGKMKNDLPLQAQVEIQGQTAAAKGLPRGETDLGKALKVYRRVAKCRCPFAADSVKQIKEELAAKKF